MVVHESHEPAWCCMVLCGASSMAWHCVMEGEDPRMLPWDRSATSAFAAKDKLEAVNVCHSGPALLFKVP